MFFEFPYYWGVGGATMGLQHQILRLGGPMLNIFLSSMAMANLLGVFFALTVLKYRPHLQNFWRMAVITILLLIPIYSEYSNWRRCKLLVFNG